MVCVKKKNFKSYIRNPAEAALSPSTILIVILEITKGEVAKWRTPIKIKVIQLSRNLQIKRQSCETLLISLLKKQ